MHSSQRERRPRVRQVGRYRLDHKLLGKGNFARVELATHTILGLQVAIKLIDKSHITEEYVRRNLGREARIMARLRHPHIAALYEAIESGHLVCLVTELAPGGDLCSYVKARAGGKLTEAQACPFLRQLVSALSYMHDRGILHRDLKMENVMLDESQTQTKIVDFGLSNFYGPGVSLMTHCGSPEYAAPELFVPGKAYGPQVDVWSLGIIMYGALTGCLPFLSPRHEGCSAHERRQRLYQKIQEGLGQHHWRALGNVSVEARHLLASLLDPDPEQRIPLHQVEQHPFITGNGRHKVLSHYEASIKDADGKMVLRRLSAILSVPSSVLEAEIERDDHCEVAAMFYLMLAALRKNRTVVSNLAPEASAWCAMASALNNNNSNIINSSSNNNNNNNSSNNNHNHNDNATESPIEVSPDIPSQNGHRGSLKPPLLCKEKGHVMAELTPLDVIKVESVSMSSQFQTETVEPLSFPDVEDIIAMDAQDKNTIKSRDSITNQKTDSEETVTEDNGTIYDSCYDDDDLCRLIVDPTPLVTSLKREAILEEETAAKTALSYRSPERSPQTEGSLTIQSDDEEACPEVPPLSPLPPPPPRRFTLRSLCFKAASDVELLAGDADACRFRGKVMGDGLPKSGKVASGSSSKKVNATNMRVTEEDLDSEDSRRWSKHKLRSFFRPKKNSTCLCMALTDTKLFLPPSSGDCHLNKESKSLLKSGMNKWVSNKWPHVCLVELLELHWRSRKWCKDSQEEYDKQLPQQQQQLTNQDVQQALGCNLGLHCCVRPLSAPANLFQSKEIEEDKGQSFEKRIITETQDYIINLDQLSQFGVANSMASKTILKQSKDKKMRKSPPKTAGKRSPENSVNCRQDVNVIGRRLRLCSKPSFQEREKWPSLSRNRNSSDYLPTGSGFKVFANDSMHTPSENQIDPRGESGCTWRHAGAERGDGEGCAGNTWLDDSRVSVWLDSHVPPDQRHLFIRGIAVPYLSATNHSRPCSSARNLTQRLRRLGSHDRSIDNRFRKCE